MSKINQAKSHAKPVEFSKNVFAVGSKDAERRFFDTLISLPKGTSYNSYLVKGTLKNALIDTVNPGFEDELIGKITPLLGDLKKLDFIIMNHAEPDHSNAIPKLLKLTKATLLASEKGAQMAEQYYKIPKERIRAVKNNETIALGGKTLRFIYAPWLHWPETMFTFLEEEKILFTCDFFGGHNSNETFDNEKTLTKEELIRDAKEYFAEIMMPFRAMCKIAFQKVKAFSPKIIAPSHGPIYTKPEVILEEYSKWVGGETKNKAIILYVSMWNSTEKMAQHLNDALKKEGIEVRTYNMLDLNLDELARDLIDTKTILLGSPTFLNSLHPLAMHYLNLVKLLKPPVKYAAYFGSYGWAPVAGRIAKETAESIGLEVLGAVEINGRPAEEEYSKLTELAKVIAGKMKN